MTAATADALPWYQALTARHESQAWLQSDVRRREARTRRRSGAVLSAAEQALAPFTVADLFAEPEIRRRTLLLFLLSLSTTLAWWGISSWVSPYVAGIAAKAHLPVQQWVNYAGMAYNLGGILGYIALGFLADGLGRKPTVMFYFAGAFLLTPVLYLWTPIDLLLVVALINGFFTWHLFTDARVAARALLDSLACDRDCICLQRAAVCRLFRPVIRRSTDRRIWWLQRYRHDLRLHLRFVVAPFLPETRGQPLPA